METTHHGSVKDGGAETSTRTTEAPRRQPPHGVETTRWHESPSLTPRRGRRRFPSLRLTAHQSPSDVAALFLSKKGKHVRRGVAGLPRARRVPNASSRCNRLGSVVFTLGELRQITNNFSADQLIGEGGFGKVYKGVLTNGDMIAVKRFASTITGLQDVQYKNEAQHLMLLKHRNIVRLVGYCFKTEMKLVRYKGKLVCAEKPERLLCLEYMPKGSLCDHLSGLDWNTRYKIIKGICYGLHYLHEGCQVTPIIHMDLKPANILLDDNMVPKIADFGLSRLFGEEQTRTCTTSRNGTRGYMAPEYIEKGVITKEFDIFSLGVIIIEIITGLRDYPTDDETETTSQQYIDRVLNNWRLRLRKAQGCTSQDTDCQEIKKCIQIGLLCVKFDRSKRPTINQIIKLLERSDEAYQNGREVAQEVARLQAENARVAARAADIESQYARVEEENTVLRARAADIASQYARVEEENTVLRARAADITSQYARVEQENTVLLARAADIASQYARVKQENNVLRARTADIASQYTRVEQENTMLRASATELRDRLCSVNKVLRIVEEFSGVAMDIQEKMPADDALLRPWQLSYPAAAMPIGALHMFHY